MTRFGYDPAVAERYPAIVGGVAPRDRRHERTVGAGPRRGVRGRAGSRPREARRHAAVRGPEPRGVAPGVPSLWHRPDRLSLGVGGAPSAADEARLDPVDQHPGGHREPRQHPLRAPGRHVRPGVDRRRPRRCGSPRATSPSSISARASARHPMPARSSSSTRRTTWRRAVGAGASRPEARARRRRPRCSSRSKATRTAFAPTSWRPPPTWRRLLRTYASPESVETGLVDATAPEQTFAA